MLRGKDIVCISSLDWEAHWTSKQQIMHRLAGANRVLYVEEPVTALAPFRVPERWKRWGCVAPRLQKQEAGLWTLTPPPLLPFGNMRREVNRVNQWVLAAYIRRALRGLGFREHLLWTYLPTTVDLVDHLDPALLVYHCVDEHSAFPGFVDPEVVSTYDSSLTSRADLVITTAAALQEARLPMNPHSFHVPNAADVTMFSHALDEGLEEPADMAVIPHPRVGVIGVHDERLDVQALEAVALADPGRQVVLVGPLQPGDVDEARLRALPNIHLLGGKRREELPAYLRALDVALIPYVRNELTRNIFPLKLYEYLAGGRPVVAAALPELVRLDLPEEMLLLAHGPGDYAALVHRALKGDNAALRRKRSAAAREHSWDARVEDISCLVEEALVRRQEAPSGERKSAGERDPASERGA